MKTYAIALFTLFAGILIGYLVFRPALETAHEHDSVEQIWTCSMHPNIRQNEPGKCPLCGMDLIPASGSATDDDPFTLQMSASALRLADIRTMTVTAITGESVLRLPGRVVARESGTHRLTSFIDGRVTAENVGFEGKTVKKGDELLRIISPEVATAWAELRMEGFSSSGAATKLRYWGLTDAQIDALRESPSAVQEIALLAPASGVVMMRDVRPGSLVMPGMVLYEIADLSAVWVEFDALEGDVAGVGVGTTVRFTVDAFASERFSGKVSFVSPSVDAMSRRVRIRLDVPNASLKLKPDMLARGEVVRSASAGLRVPSSAVLWTGPRSVVYVKTDATEPTFQLREVTLGPKTGDTYLITKGLQAGENIVVNGAFTIDAEFQLAGKASMMNRPEQAASTASIPENTYLKPVMDAYFPVKDALLASNAQAGVTAAKRLLAVIRAQPLRDAQWNALRGDLIQRVEHWEHSPDIEAQRANLFKLSDALRAGLKTYGAGQVAYVQYCPMAFNNTGARWLSKSEKIENPYLPETMLGCGEVISMI